MLVLVREAGQAVIIKLGAEVVRVTLIDFRGQGARLGFEAADEAAIWREEIYTGQPSHAKGAAE